MNGLDRWKVARKRLGSLPRWAQVQFACRCARRALPFYPGRAQNLKIIVRAVQIAEAAAAAATPALPDDAVERMRKYYTAEGEAAKAGDISNSYYAAAAAYAAYLAAMDKPTAGAVAVSSQEAAEMSLLACRANHEDGDPRVARLAKSIIGDLLVLEALARRHCWTDNDAVTGAVLPSLRHKCSGKSANLVLNDEAIGASVTISVNSASEMVRNGILSRIGLSAKAILGSFAHEPKYAGAGGDGSLPSPGDSSELLSEKSYRLLKRLSEIHCKMNKTTWYTGIIHRANANRYVAELESRGFVLRDARNLYSISQAGLEHLADHPRKTSAGTQFEP